MEGIGRARAPKRFFGSKVNRTSATLVLLVVAGLVILMVSGCGQKQAPSEAPKEEAEEEAKETPAAEEPEVYKIGFVNHLTGDAAVYGQSMKKGIEVGLKEIEEAGGINGKKVDMIYEDDRLVATDAITAVRKLVEVDKVPVIIGSSSSSITLSMLPVSRELGIVQVGPVSTNPALRQFRGTYFGVMPTDEAQGLEWAKIAKHFGYNEVAVMYINNDYGIGVKDAFITAYEKDGGKILIAEPYDVGKSDFRTEILKVKAAKPPVVFIVGHVKEGSIVLKQARELALDVQFIGDVALESKEVIDLAGPAAEGFAVLRVGLKNSPAYANFEKKFRELHNQDPTIWADFAYDSIKLVAEAIKTNGYTPEGIRKFFQEVEDYPGASGPKTFDEDGIAFGVYDLYRVKDGKFEYWDYAKE